MKKNTIKLYKYHKFNMHLMELLVSNKFHLSTRVELNDPYDLHFNISKSFLHTLFNEGKSKINVQQLLDDFIVEVLNPQLISEIDFDEWNINDWIDLIFESDENQMIFVNLLLNIYNYKVISFSKPVSPDKETLMWAHYAGYDGVRLTFKLPITYNSNDYLNSYVVEPVKYNDNKPIIDSPEDIEEMMYVKSKNWKYEKEHRIVRQYASELSFKKEHLTEIAFGNKLTFEQKNMIFNIVNKLEYDVDFTTMVLYPLGMEFDPLRDMYFGY